MLSFALRGRIADVDETIPDEPCHPAIVLVVETGDTFARIVVPESVLQAKRELLCVGRPVQVFGEVKESRRGLHHVASEVRLVGVMH